MAGDPSKSMAQQATEVGSVVRDEHSGDLFVVKETPDRFGGGDPDNEQATLEAVEDGRIHSVFADIYRSNYRHVADSRDEL